MIVSKTPLRVSFAGGGTDLPAFYEREDGEVVSTAIDKYIYVIVNKSFGDRIHVSYSKKETVYDVDEIHHDLVRESMKKAGIRNGIEITTMADVPSEGSGLGSSSALTVGLLNALYRYSGIHADKMRLAEDACDIEMNVLGRPIGKQDQYIAAFGGVKHFFFRKGGWVDFRCVLPSPEMEEEMNNDLLLFYTGISRQASSILEFQSKNTPGTMSILRRMKELVPEAIKFIDGDRLDSLGYLLTEGGKLKDSLSPSPENDLIQVLFSSALKAGATGGKICGAGGGGFLLLHCKRENQQAVREALSGFRELQFSLEPKGSQIILG